MRKNMNHYYKLRLTFILGLLLFIVIQSFAQEIDSLAWKYSLYRKKLNTVFVKVPWGTNGIGNLIKDENGVEAIPPVFEYSGCSFPVTTLDLNRNELESGDGTIMHGHYVALLATEIAVLKNQKQDITKTLEELFLSLQTIKRLDMLANIMFEKSIEDLCKVKKIKNIDKIKSSIRKDGYSGFFLRDDVYWANNINKESSWATGYTDILSDYIKYKNLALGAFLTGNAPIVSQDQVYGLMLGLGFVNALLDDGIPSEKIVKDEARKIASGLIISNFSSLKLPGTNFKVPRGNNNSPFRWQLLKIAKKWELKDAIKAYSKVGFFKKISNYFIYGTGYNWLGIADDWTEYRKSKIMKCTGDYRDNSNMKLRLECLDSDDPVTLFRFAYKNQKPVFGLIQEIMRKDYLNNPNSFISKKSSYQKYRNKTANELYNLLQIAPLNGPSFNINNLKSKWNVDNLFSNYEPKTCNGKSNSNVMYNGIDYMLLYNIMQLTCSDLKPELKNATPYTVYNQDVIPILNQQIDKIYEVNSLDIASSRSSDIIELETKAINLMYDWKVEGGTFVHPSGDYKKVAITPNAEKVIVTLKMERCDKWSNTGCISKTLISNQTKIYPQKNSGSKN
jgi:hypothetical protein